MYQTSTMTPSIGEYLDRFKKTWSDSLILFYTKSTLWSVCLVLSTVHLYALRKHSSEYPILNVYSCMQLKYIHTCPFHTFIVFITITNTLILPSLEHWKSNPCASLLRITDNNPCCFPPENVGYSPLLLPFLKYW